MNFIQFKIKYGQINFGENYNNRYFCVLNAETHIKFVVSYNIFILVKKQMVETVVNVLV